MECADGWERNPEARVSERSLGDEVIECPGTSASLVLHPNGRYADSIPCVWSTPVLEGFSEIVYGDARRFSRARERACSLN